MRSISDPGDGLRRWRKWIGSRCVRLCQRLGLIASLVVRYEAAATAASPETPKGFSLRRWRPDDPTFPNGVSASLDPDDVVVGATDDGQLAGYCVLSARPVRVREVGGVVEPAGVCLWDLYVEPPYRGRGLGTALVQFARMDDVVADAGTVEALVAADNEPSRRAFRAAGFAPAGRIVAVGWRDHTVSRTRRFGSTETR